MAKGNFNKSFEDLKKDPEYEWLTKKRYSIAMNFTRIGKGDIILMPYPGGVAIGEALEKRNGGRI